MDLEQKYNWKPIYLDAVPEHVLKVCNRYMKEYLALLVRQDQIADPREKMNFLKSAAKKNFLFFISLVHPDTIRTLKMRLVLVDDTGKHFLGLHGLLACLFQYTIEHPGTYLADMAPRQHGKTFILGHLGFLWLSLHPGKGRNNEVSYITASGTLAKQVGGMIRRDLETNQRLLHLWGEQRKTGYKWNEDRLEFANGSIINFNGAGYQTRGPHPWYAMLDDLETGETARSKAMTDSIKSWTYQDFWGQLEVSDPRIVNGTNNGRATMLDEIFTDPLTGKPREGFLTIRFRSCDKIKISGSTYQFKNAIYPTKFGSKNLKRLHATMGDWAFDSEYQNQPHGKDDPIFRKEWIVTNEVEESAVPHDKDADTLIAMDPAYGIKQVNDFTGWTIGKISLRKGPDFGCIYIQDASHDRLDTEKKVSLVFNLHAIYRPTAIFLETDADKKQLHDNIIYRSQEFRVSPPIIPVESGGKDKALRASSVQALVSGGRVKFIRGKYPAFIDELLRFDGTDNCGHDDMVDAFVYLLKQCQVWYLPMAKPKEEDIPKPPSIVDRFRERLKMEQGQNVDVKRLVRFGTAAPIRDGGT